MANKVDIRILKTKVKLKKTLVTLLKTKSIDEISISEICAAAQINRNTFYSHYANVKSIFEEVKANYLEDFIGKMKDYAKNTENFQKFVCQILEDMKENKEVCCLIFQSQNSESFLKTVVQFILPSDLKNLESESMDIHSEDIYCFLVGGIVNLIDEWVENNMAESTDSMGMKIAFFVQTFKVNYRIR